MIDIRVLIGLAVFGLLLYLRPRSLAGLTELIDGDDEVVERETEEEVALSCGGTPEWAKPVGTFQLRGSRGTVTQPGFQII